jgi:hypothetical protein
MTRECSNKQKKEIKMAKGPKWVAVMSGVALCAAADGVVPTPTADSYQAISWDGQSEGFSGLDDFAF